ncbi:DUF1211 domain-containing protein [Streptomyces sp. PLAI1-29]|uniref:DUF1211 domain-containing protein n=1 Tax=Streptomyces zingiberis TaxID=2053010 RepID=A0ABX1C1G8_9ACTN|nr:DUF1211 domain-containing protein [Streptomyces zingiberis]
MSDPDTRRAEAFSDAVLAIVITLLVLDLHPPPERPGTLLTKLLHQWPTYVAYVASYLYVAVVWLNHKAAFCRVRVMDRGLHWANLAVLFSTALLPWPTAMVSTAIAEGAGSDARVAVAVYALVGVLTSLAWLALFHHLGRHPELAWEHVAENFFSLERVRALVGIVLYTAAGLVGALLHPLTALAVFCFLPLFYGVTSHGLTELSGPLRRFLPRGRGHGG